MDISRVRMKFQKPWNFFIHTDTSLDLSQALYSLQQESLNSDDMLLYVTSEVRPAIEGHVISADGQKWLVYQTMKEVVNQQLYEFRLLPVLGSLTLKQINVAANDLGMVPVSGPSLEFTLDCFIDEYSQKERTVPTKQATEAYQQTFMVAAAQFPGSDKGYELFYTGIKYKIESFERLYGVIKIRATEDV